MKITVKDYIEYSKLPEGVSEEKAVSTLLGFDIKALSLKDAEKLLEEIRQWFFKENRDFSPTFTHEGVEYGFIPDLDSGITYGENQDLCKYISDTNELHRAMAVAYRPITSKQGSKYLIEPYEGSNKYASIMLDVDVEVALGMKVFFWSLTNELERYILKYSTAQESQQSSDLSGAHTEASIL